MICWEIKTEKQENGLWGSPLTLIETDEVPLDDETNLLRSAIIIALMEKFGNEKFRIFFSTPTGFFVKFTDSGYFNIRYEDYILDGYTLHFSKEFLEKKILR